MDAPPRSHSDSSREQLSPDGKWRVVYDYTDGEKTPLVVSPQVIETATDRVVVDLWRSGLDGSVTDFTSTGFRLTVRDPYYPKQLVATVDATTGTFVFHGEPGGSYPLPDLYSTLRAIIEESRRDYRAQHPPPPRPRPESSWQRVRRWINGGQ